MGLDLDSAYGKLTGSSCSRCDQVLMLDSLSILTARYRPPIPISGVESLRHDLCSACSARLTSRFYACTDATERTLSS